MTTVTTQNPVRSDLASTEAAGADRTTTPSRLWAVAGIGAALAGAGTIVTSSAVDIVYRDEFSHGSVTGVADALSDKTGVLFAFHAITALGAVLMIVFARRAVPPAPRDLRRQPGAGRGAGRPGRHRGRLDPRLRPRHRVRDARRRTA